MVIVKPTCHKAIDEGDELIWTKNVNPKFQHCTMSHDAYIQITGDEESPDNLSPLYKNLVINTHSSFRFLNSSGSTFNSPFTIVFSKPFAYISVQHLTIAFLSIVIVSSNTPLAARAFLS